MTSDWSGLAAGAATVAAAGSVASVWMLFRAGRRPPTGSPWTLSRVSPGQYRLTNTSGRRMKGVNVIGVADGPQVTDGRWPKIERGAAITFIAPTFDGSTRPRVVVSRKGLFAKPWESDLPE